MGGSQAAWALELRRASRAQAMAGTFVEGVRAALNTPLSLEHTPADAAATANHGAGPCVLSVAVLYVCGGGYVRALRLAGARL